MKRLIIASGNQGKIREFQGLLGALPLDVQPQPSGLDIEETGASFAATLRAAPPEIAKTARASDTSTTMAWQLFNAVSSRGKISDNSSSGPIKSASLGDIHARDSAPACSICRVPGGDRRVAFLSPV